MAALANPLRCSGAGVRPNVLLTAKLIALCLLLTNHVRLLPEPVLPFFPLLDRIPGALFQWTLRVVFIGSAAALLFNRRVQASCLALGLSILLGVGASKAYYSPDRLVCGTILFLAALDRPRLLRWQAVIVYVGLALDRLLGSEASPVRAIGDWAVIVAAAAAAAAFSFRRLWPLGIWLNLLFQSCLMLFSGSTSNLLFYAMAAASLAFVSWPERVTVIYDGDCGFCNRTRERWQRFDFDRLLDWQPLQSGVGGRFRIPQSELEQRVYVAAGGRRYSGFAAFKMMALWNPTFYFAVALLMFTPLREAAAVAVLVLFSPLFSRLGEAAYDAVARNRHRLSAETKCKVS